MNLNNGILSKRQWFRMSMMECITLSMMIIPYVSITFAGEHHVYAFFLGLGFAVLYGIIMSILAKRYPEGYINIIRNYMGKPAYVIEIIYGLRYVVRAAFITIFFSMVVQRFLMRGFSIYTIAISFLILCGYGASKTMEGRGRMLEMLFWWMLVPLIVLVVFSISNINVGELGMEIPGRNTGFGIWKGGYGILLALSPLEFQIYSQPCVKGLSKNDKMRFLVWTILALMFSYLFIVGILGLGLAGSSAVSSFNVMEAATIPGDAVKRFDYPVMAFWIIGVFAIVSGYLHYASDYVRSVFSIRTNSGIKLNLIALVVIAIVIVFIFQNDLVADYCMRYFLYADFALSVLVPAIVAFVKKKQTRIWGNVCISVVFGIAIVCVICMNEDVGESFILRETEALECRQKSLEQRDYVRTMEINTNSKGQYTFSFSVADLTDYQGGENMEEKKYVVRADCLKNAIAAYYDREQRQLDLGHLQQIEILNMNERWRELLVEMGNYPGISKAITVVSSEQGNKYILRDMIKASYEGESF